MGRLLIILLRWLLVIPAAYLAAWLITRLPMLALMYQPNINSQMASIMMQIGSGAIIGFVGVHVAPNFKRFALALCTLLSLSIATVYFLRYSDLLGGISAAAHVAATVVAGFIAVAQSQAPQKTP